MQRAEGQAQTFASATLISHGQMTLFSALPLLNLSRHPLEEAGMFMWILIGAMAVVGGVWVKTRRQRKSKAPGYAGGN